MKTNFTTPKLNKKLLYKISKPTNNITDLEVIFLLHGYGSNDKDLFSLKEFFPPNYIIISLRAPISLGFDSYAWYSINFQNTIDKWVDKDEAITSKKIILNDILLHLEDLDLKDKRISLLGFSQGAILSWSLGIENPHLIKNIIPLSGFYNPEFTNTSQNSKFKLSCFSSHGINDPVIPIHWAQKGIQSLKENNINIIFKEYVSGHEINNENLKDMIEWLYNN